MNGSEIMYYSDISSISGTSGISEGKLCVDTGYTGDYLVTTSTNPYWNIDVTDKWKLSNEFAESTYEAAKEQINRPMKKINEIDKKENKKDMKKETKQKVMPYDIVDYKVIDNTVVIFTFGDGTTEKTVCDHEFDKFELKRAIELAVCKKKFGGTKAYHKAVNNAIKQIENIDAKKKAEAEEKERIANRKAKYAERQAKRKAKRRQEQIDIQSEAFLKAMLAYDDAIVDVSNVLDVPDENAVDSTETK